MEHLLAEYLMVWVVRGTTPQAEPSEFGTGSVMRPCARYLGMLACCALVIASPLLIALMLAPEKMLQDLDAASATAFVVFLVLAGCLYFLGLGRQSVTLDDEGFTLHRPFRGPLRIEWMEIESVAHKPWPPSLELHRIVGPSVRLTLAMNGLGTLHDRLEKFIPRALTAEARACLPGPDGSPPKGRESAPVPPNVVEKMLSKRGLWVFQAVTYPLAALAAWGAWMDQGPPAWLNLLQTLVFGGFDPLLTSVFCCVIIVFGVAVPVALLFDVLTGQTPS